ncbi:contractile injection system tape measure protein [Thalassomonas sp. RHCl1]|uniref:contractile injection system tape measure protein n=1 Tax=Thalassomonas sp. RHCl1 TaxID=2995320 RepID=UPI00248C54EC|nr:contractile injection system tape measure protein [Thalassomonas sp. RHCl1]
MNNHLIDKICVEIHLPDAGHAYEFQHNISALVHNELMNVISEHCDQLCPDNNHVTMEKLELDLGKLSADNFVQAFSEQFTRHFPRELSIQTNEQLTRQAEQELISPGEETAAIDSSQPHGQGKGSVGVQAPDESSQTPARLKTMQLKAHEHAWLLLSHFLNHATLPWYVDAGQFTGVTATLELLIDQEKLDIPAFKNQLKNQTATNRLISQFDDKTLNRLYAHLTGMKNGIIINWPELLTELLRSLQQIDAQSFSPVSQQSSQQKTSQSHTSPPAGLSEQEIWQGSLQENQHHIRRVWEIIWDQLSIDNSHREIFSLILKQISASLNPDTIQSFTRHLHLNKQVQAAAGDGYPALLAALNDIILPLRQETSTARENIQNNVLPEQGDLSTATTSNSIQMHAADTAGSAKDIKHQQESQSVKDKVGKKISAITGTNPLFTNADIPTKTEKPESGENGVSTDISNKLNNVQGCNQPKDMVNKKPHYPLREQKLSPADSKKQSKTNYPYDMAENLSDTEESLPATQEEASESSAINSSYSAQKTSQDLPDNEQAPARKQSQNSKSMDNCDELKQSKKTNQNKHLTRADKQTQPQTRQNSAKLASDEAENLPVGKRSEEPINKGNNLLSKNKQPSCFIPEVAAKGLPVENAGLVIFWPYLHIYFKDLGLFNGKDFKDLQAREKAVHLLQYLATGEANTEEHALVLNKLLCRWDFNHPLNRYVELSQKEREESEKLIQAVINHWSILGNTSITSFRHTFVARKGLLSHQDNGWLLRVEKGPYDVLLDNIPWGLSMIKLSWVEELLQVEW